MPDYTTGQDLGREWRTFVDQHERVWGASSSKKTGRPCNALEPQFTAPLVVPREFIQVDAVDSRLVHIDYDSWIESIERGEKIWLESVQKWAVNLGVQGTVQAIIDDPPPQILDLVGPKPTRSATPIRAAKAGNKWVLGLSTVVPEKAREFFPEMFIKEHEAHVAVDPFAEPEPTPDPFADEEPVKETKKAPADEKTNGVAEDLGNGKWLVDGKQYPDWVGRSWIISSGEAISGIGMSKEDHRAFAQEKEKALHVQE